MEISLLIGKFCLRCSYMENSKVEAFPKRAFKKKFSAWALDASYDNAVVLLQNFTACSTPEAVALAQQIIDSIKPAEIVDEIPPSVLVGILPHQQECIRRAFPHPAFAILHRPRCRKTATTIRLASARFLAGQIDRMVVLCPNSIKSVWADEFPLRSVVPHSVHVLESGKGKKMQQWAATISGRQLGVLVASIEGMSAGQTQDLVNEFLGHLGHRTMVVVDESTRIKNHKSTRTETIWELGGKCGYRNILTGSEITRTPSDLFAQFRFLGVHTLCYDSFYAFRNRYVVMGGFACKKEIGCKNVEELMARIGCYSHLVKTSDIVDLPEKTFAVRLLEPTPEQKNYAKEIQKYMESTTPEGEEVKVKTAMTGMLRCQQIAGGFFPALQEDGSTTPVPLKKNPKLDELMEILSEEPGKVVIWARFVPEIEAIRSAVAKKYGEESVVTFYGENDVNERRSSRVAFQTNDAVRHFVGNPTCGSMGLELSAASLMVYYSMDFTYESRVQSLERGTNLDKGVGIGVIDLVLNTKAD